MLLNGTPTVSGKRRDLNGENRSLALHRKEEQELLKIIENVMQSSLVEIIHKKYVTVRQL